ncbi:two-component sensor histidine kinase [Actinoplanes sp. NBRC 14428]|nr:two-component sensor histidine kinase [Actinoplanes sp. NBRC 14428]
MRPPGSWQSPRPWGSAQRRARAAVVIALGFHVLGDWKHATALDRPAGIVAAALLLLGPLTLILRDRVPVAVLAAAGTASLGVGVLLPPSGTYAVAPAMALYAAVKAGRARPAAAVTAALYAAYLTVTRFLAGPLGVPEDVRPDLRDALTLALAAALMMFLGGAARARSAYLAELTKVHAARARAKEEQERRQASDERLRIARELHDVLGHHLSLINVQAGVGLHLMDNRPEQAREALTAIKTASAEALREVRVVLGVLRPDEEAAPRQPALGLDRLDDLTADAGLPVRTATTGPRRPLPAEVDRAAYRIVQEALTNVRRHAAASTADIAIEYAPGELRLRIRNDGAATDEPDGTGSGIAGMRARAESLGGTLSAGPLPEGGYLVATTLPTPATNEGEP